MKRRSFLAMLGLAPAIPVLTSLPAPVEAKPQAVGPFPSSYGWRRETGQSPYTVNDAARRMMARNAQFVHEYTSVDKDALVARLMGNG